MLKCHDEDRARDNYRYFKIVLGRWTSSIVFDCLVESCDCVTARSEKVWHDGIWHLEASGNHTVSQSGDTNITGRLITWQTCKLSFPETNYVCVWTCEDRIAARIILWSGETIIHHILIITWLCLNILLWIDTKIAVKRFKAAVVLIV